MADSHASRPPIAIVGFSALCPGDPATDGFLRVIFDGVDQIRSVPESRFSLDDYFDPDPNASGDKTYCTRGSFIDATPFDPVEFGIPPKVIEATDSAQLLTLQKAKELMQRIGADKWSDAARERVSVIIGAQGMTQMQALMMSRMQWPNWVEELEGAGLGKSEAFEVADRIAGHQPSWQEMSFPGFLGNIIAGRVTNRLDFGGTNYIVDAACASALAALSAAMNELYLGQCDLAVSGGVDLLTDIGSFVSFSRTGALSKKGDCRPFSKNADGTVIGEGIVLVGLRRLEDAERDGDKIYAVIRGHGTSSDGRGSAIYAPRAEGQVRAMERAYEAAGYSPQTVGLAEAHGTGTPLGDATEVKSMSQVLGGPGRRVRCALGSVKSQIGHPKTSAGAVALMKVASALHERILPPTIKVDEPNDQLQAEDCPLYLNTTARPWISGEEHPRRASLSAFGFGGTNAHLTVEEYEGAHRAKRRLKFPSQLFMLGGADRAAVLRAAAAVVKQAEDGFAFDALAKASQETFDRKAPARLALVAATPVKFSALFEKVSGLLKDGGALPANFEGAAFSDAAPLDGDVAFLFPGQGSQSLGMGGEIAMHFEAARKIWDEEAQRARIEGRRALHSVVFPEPTWDEAAKSQQESALKATEVAQPALAVTELSYLALMKSVGVSCDLAIGHSFGEIIALHQAGAFNAEAAVRIAEKRGALMSSAGAGVKGAMVAVSLEKQAVEAAIEASGADVGIANENAPKQTVVSGRLEEIEKFEAALPGGAFRRLPVSSAFHSSVVAGASSVFEAYLAGVWRDAPQGEVIANTTAAPYGEDIASCRSTLAEQISKPVKFVDSVRAAHAKGVRIFVEVGPGDVLTKLTRQCLDGVVEDPYVAIALDHKKRRGVATFFQGLGALAVAGASVDFDALWADHHVDALEEPVALKPHIVWIDSTVKRLSERDRLKGGTAKGPRPPERAQKPARPAPAPQPSHIEAERAVAPARPEAGSPASVSPPRGVSGAVMNEEPKKYVNGQSESFQLAPPVPTDKMPPAPGSVAGAAPAHIQPTPEARQVLPPATLGPQGGLEAVHADASAVHEQFLSVMLESHNAFLQLTRDAIGGGVMAGSGQQLTAPAALAPAPVAPFRAEAAPAPARAPAPAPSPNLDAAVVSPAPASAPPPVAPPPAPVAVQPAAAAPAANGAANGAAAPALSAERIKELAIEVIAEKTGYPSDTLEDSMELESDLGVDSISRVEIFMALKDKAPGLIDPATADQAEIGNLVTIGDIGAYLARMASNAAEMGAPPPDVVEPPSPAPAAADEAPASSGASAEDIKSVVVEIVADKTGYPTDLLEMDMQLEADLGVDSIKRMEILMGLGDKLPGQAPSQDDVDMNAVSNLLTLQDVVDFLAQAASSASHSDASAQAELEAGSADYLVPVEPSAQVEPLDRFLATAVDAPATGFALPGLGDGNPVLIIQDKGGVADALAEEFSRRGVGATVAGEAVETASKVVFLPGLDAVAGAEGSHLLHLDAFKAAKTAAMALMKPGGVFVSAQDTGGAFGFEPGPADKAWAGGLSGVVKTIGKCWPDTQIKAIDIERGARDAAVIAAAIADELFEGGREIEVGLAADGRRRTTALALPNAYGSAIGAVSGPIVDDASVIVVSGGARGVTAACLEALASAHRPKFVIMARSPLADEPEWLRGAEDEAALKKALIDAARQKGERFSPAAVGKEATAILASREARGCLDRLRALGSDVLYRAVDVRDAAAVSEVLDEARAKWGGITGLIHAAGVLADKLIVEKTPEQFSRVFETKVAGFDALLKATADDPLKLIVAFSSVAAQFGNIGQVDYSSANEVLNKVCQSEARARDGVCLVRSINWGAWDGGMVSPELARHMREASVELIPLADGAAFFRDVVTNADAGAVEIVATAQSNLAGLAGRDEAATRRLISRQANIQAAE